MVAGRFAIALRAMAKISCWRRFITLAALVALTACGGGGNDRNDSVAMPKNLSYQQPPAQLVGDPIPQLKPTVEGTVDTYSVSPSLPDGLTIDAKTGVISGTPNEEVDAKSYVVTATNKGGSTSFTVQFSFSEGEHTEPVSPGSVALASIDPSKLVALATPLRFDVIGAEIPATKQGISVFNGDTQVPSSDIDVQGNSIIVTSALKDGRNDIVLLASDTHDRALSFKTTLWAGAHTLTVVVSNPDGTVPAQADVGITILDAQGLAIQRSTTNGQLTLENLPDRTILLNAKSGSNLTATLTTVGTAGNVQLKLQGINTPSSIDNNDFSQGTSGWDASKSDVLSIVPHVEEIVPVGQPSAAKLASPAAAGAANRLLSWQAMKSAQVAASSSNAIHAHVLAAASADSDLMLTTSGEGPSSVSRTFAVPPGNSTVKIRYRFITSEVPGGYFGSNYNDSYSVQIRSQAGGGTASDANSMNSMGLAAFDASGSTAWRVLTLPVSPQGDNVQVDATVTNVGDGLFDSEVVIDFVGVDKLAVTTDLASACVNQPVTFTATGASANSAAWSGGGSPATGAGNTFKTRFTAKGDFQVTATAESSAGQQSVHIKESSGAAWVARFPTSTSLTDLAPGFQTNATNFYDALQTAGASVVISATYRPPERAFLMHYAWEIAKKGFNPANVPEYEGIDICWVHRTADGEVDAQASKAAAQAMVNGYHMAHAAALQSQHTQRQAVDMTITWSNTLTIRGADGNNVTISTTPRTGAGNTNLHTVGAGYGVLKLVSDAPHWSANGH
jgi:hypothetical protein